MDIMDYLIEFHKYAERQGPGSDEAAKKALRYIPELDEDTRILDIGCGTGAQTMVLAKNTKAKIVAVDMLQKFLNKLKEKIDRDNLNNRVIAIQSSMDNLHFEEKLFDVIWSEGAIYNIGFKKGLSEWKRFLKDEGYIAVSEISWLTHNRPEEIEQYWTDAFLERYNYGEDVQEFIKMGLDEIKMYEKFKEYYSYVYYIAKKPV